MIKTALTKAQILELIEARKTHAWDCMKLFGEDSHVYPIYEREWYEMTKLIRDLEGNKKAKR